MISVHWCEYFIAPYTEDSYITILMCFADWIIGQSLFDAKSNGGCGHPRQGGDGQMRSSADIHGSVDNPAVLFAWRLKDLLMLKGLMRHLFSTAQRNGKLRLKLTTARLAQYNKHFVKILKQCLGCNLRPVSLLIFTWPFRTKNQTDAGWGSIRVLEF